MQGSDRTSFIVCDALTVRYGRLAALRDVNLTFEPGITGVLGPNGAGKSTLLRCIATAQWPTEGHISVDGLRTDNPNNLRLVRRRLGYLSQDPKFYPSFTAASFLDYMGMLKEVIDAKERRERVAAALDAVGLADRAKAKIRTLSGGMRQRLALAQAILTSPAALVLDEPAAGLDPEERFRFRDLLLSVSSTTTVVLSTHLTDDVALACSSVIVLVDGRVPFEGTVEDLIETARGRVWSAEIPDPRSPSWRTSDGRYRCVGDPPTGAELAVPTVEDGYLAVRSGLVGR